MGFADGQLGLVPGRTLDKVSQQHLDFARTLRSLPELLHGNIWVFRKLLAAVLGQYMRPLLPATFILLHPAVNGRSRGVTTSIEVVVVVAASGCCTSSMALAEAVAQRCRSGQTALASPRPLSKELPKQLCHNGRVHGPTATHRLVPVGMLGKLLQRKGRRRVIGWTFVQAPTAAKKCFSRRRGKSIVPIQWPDSATGS